VRARVAIFYGRGEVSIVIVCHVRRPGLAGKRSKSAYNSCRNNGARNCFCNRYGIIRRDN